MVVQHNMQAMNANRMLGVTTSAQAKSTEKLSSGYKINRAADDAAGLTISEKMRKQILEEDWGERGQFGTAYIAELSQGNEHYAVGEIMVAYEKVNVTYRLTFDQDMRLAGLYVR